MSLQHKIAVIAQRVHECKPLDIDDFSDLQDAAKQLDKQEETIAYFRRLTRDLREEINKRPKGSGDE
ncbi:MAG: hypothetical protein JKY34_07480 [Kordiimonadaceae bacterium]|nr:hypothetical protein [Kordiimonadaceae bacterium]